MLKAAIIGLAICSMTTATLAQAPARAPGRFPKPPATEAQLDTLNMTCAEAITLVRSRSQGIVLRTGQNRWDKYVHDGEACGPVQHDLAPQFVRTKDNRACHIGFTCEDLEGQQ